YREAAELKQRLSKTDGAPVVIERGLAAYRSDDEAGATALHRLLERQHYRLAYWRVAFSAVNYRRFFDINDLAGLRVENPATFRAIHGLVERLIGEDKLQGLRLDHIDGLRDPVQYTLRLRRLIQKARREARLRGRYYVVVEKILGDQEPLPHFPGVAGTTGYEWLNVISRVLVNGDGLDPLERTWRDFTGERTPFERMVKDAKTTVIGTMLASEFTVLCQQLARIAAGHFSTRDFTIDRLRAALQAYVLTFPVYRTYVTAGGASPEDRKLIEDAIRRARAAWEGPDPDIFDFLREVITLDLAKNPSYSAPRVRNFALKLQQFTGPLTAKALEDTAFYRYHRLIALNEVGGEPALPALGRDEFHHRQQQHVETEPAGLTATATHDTKRGEDARARILALSELAHEWDTAVREWRTQNAPLIRHANGERYPSLGHEYMLYQALIGAWPIQHDESFADRMVGYALKAAREGKQETSWTNNNEAYEAGLEQFVRNLLDDRISAPFLDSFGTFAERTALLGALNGLSQLALKAMLPGVPDFYQGTEFWDLSLVDPDNRRAVDFNARADFLKAQPEDWQALSRNWRDGRIKMALTDRLLRARRDQADLFRRGSYEPLQVTGPHAEHVIAFARTWRRQQVVIAVARHFVPLTEEGRRWPAEIDAKVTPPSDATYADVIGSYPKVRTRDLNLRHLFHQIPIAVLRRT
ncbi:MAG TPA: malto-oligosyltrehalose synthase, partial [Pseudolabrys sp.]|nr:malto-oligosyltrehalose synthase [Pseudolabrys sp.]